MESLRFIASWGTVSAGALASVSAGEIYSAIASLAILLGGLIWVGRQLSLLVKDRTSVIDRLKGIEQTLKEIAELEHRVSTLEADLKAVTATCEERKRLYGLYNQALQDKKKE